MAITRVDSPEWAANLKAFSAQQTAMAQPNGMIDPLEMRKKLQSQGIPLANTDQQAANVLQQTVGTATPMSADSAFGMHAPETARPTVPPTVAPNQAPTTAQPVSAQQAFQPPDYAALAAARTSAALAQKRTIAEQQKGSLDRSFQRTNQITQDNRTLENAQTNRTLSPFSGKTSFDKGIIGRERTLADESSQNNLLAQKSNIDSLLADYENATADERVRIADELQRADRQYQLELSNQSGVMANGQKTAAQSNADRSFNQSQQQIDYAQNPNNPQNQGQALNNAGQALTNKLNELKLGNYPQEVKQQAQLFEQQVAAGKMSNEAAEYNLSQLKDPNSASNRAKDLELQMKQLEAANLPEQQRLQLQQLRKQIAEIGVVHYKPQTDNEIAMDKVHLETAQEQLKQLKSPVAPKGQTAEGYASYVDGVAKYDNGSNSDNGAKQLTNPIDVEKSILQSGLPEAEMRKLYTRFGLNWGD